MIMRVAIGIHGSDVTPRSNVRAHVPEVLHTRHAHFVQCGNTRPQLSSCFARDEEDSIEGIYDTLKVACISKYTGGIGSVHNIRATDSIRGSNGTSNGIVPMLRVCNDTANTWTKEGETKAVAIYLEPWHADIETFWT